MKNKSLFLFFTTSVCVLCVSACGLNGNDQRETTLEAELISEKGTTNKLESDEKSKEKETSRENNIEDVELDESVYSLSNESIVWGVGSQVYEDNRPVEPVNIQEKYGSRYAIDAIKENEKNIYLTFDEGYENGYTAAILDTLKEKNVKAVFFVTMPYVKEEPKLIQRMIDEGHIVGAHSVTHPSNGMPSLTADEQLEEYKKLHLYVKENFGYTMWLFRPPTGAFSEQSLAVAQKCGYRTVLWSFAYKDWITDNQPDADFALNNAVEKLHNGAIYLLHAVSSTNAEILGDFIDKAIEKGYTFMEYK